MKKQSDMVHLDYDYKLLEIDESEFVHNADWKIFYGDVEENIPPNMTEL